MAQRIRLKDTVTEMRVFSTRLVVALLGVLLLFTILFARYFFLQVVDHDLYQRQSDNNRIYLKSVAPKRGLVFDRNGELLAQNLPSYTLTLTPERVENIEATLDRLRQLLDISDEEVTRFQQQLPRARPFEAIPLRFRLTEEEIARVAVDRYRLPGVEIEARLLRHYPHGDLFAHVLGYVARINEAELRDLDPVNYGSTHHIGKVGVERVYESELHGQVGSEQVETTARGKVQRVLERIDPVPGQDLVLSLDMRVQRAATEALSGERGAVVAIDPTGGGLIALVSTPSFDPNLFVRGISRRDYAALRDSPDKPLFNRALQGQYPPASTVKPMFALAGLHYGLVDVDYAIADPGWFSLPGDERQYRDWKKWGHGPQVTLRQAIVESCDVYFYQLAHRLGIQRLHDFAVNFGLGKQTGVDLSAENSGLMPSDEWKRRSRAMVWFPGETLSVGIGQGYMLTTPIQLATMIGWMATQGHRVRPRVLMSVDGRPSDREILPRIELRKEVYWQIVLAAMEKVVHDKRGTAHAIATDASFRMAGKTGTAQVVGIAQGEEYEGEQLGLRLRDHTLFVGFAPAENPQIAVAVIIENGAGRTSAAPVARKVFDAWISTQPLSPSILQEAS